MCQHPQEDEGYGQQAGGPPRRSRLQGHVAAGAEAEPCGEGKPEAEPRSVQEGPLLPGRRLLSRAPYLPRESRLDPRQPLCRTALAS